jgi:Tol biopolymer transport system component/pimeloyl-ACP methyl ester carboxylesterase
VEGRLRRSNVAARVVGLSVALQVLAATAIPIPGIQGPVATVRAADPPSTSRVSVSSTGAQGTGRNQDSGLITSPSVSADGRYVAFASDSPNLVAGDTNGTWDIFVRDTLLGTTTLASVNDAGEQTEVAAGNPGMSANGRFVAFSTFASNLVAGDTNNRPDVFVRDLESGQTTRISVATDGSESDAASGAPDVSADGRFIAFVSLSTNLVPGDTNGSFDILVRDRTLGTTERVSIASDGGQGSGPDLFTGRIRPSISADGRFVAFATTRRGLVPGDEDAFIDVFRHDRETGTTLLASADMSGFPPGAISSGASISSDGSAVGFVSFASTLVPGDTNARPDGFVRDITAGVTTRISVNADGQQSSGDTVDVSLSESGRWATFSSSGSDLVGGDTNGRFDTFLRDTVAGTTERLSVSTDAAQGNGNSFDAAVSGDGRHVAFQSVASNLVPDDTNGFNDIFIRDLAAPLPAGPLPVIFVHGLGASQRDPGYEDLLVPLIDQFGDRVTAFTHYQDVSNGQDQPCANGPALVPEEPNGGMPVDLGSIDPEICDSQADIGLNAVQLHHDIRQAFDDAGGRPVVLIANSMGGAIVRGFLAYSAERGDRVASDMVDSIFFIEGAQAGALWLRISGLRDTLGPVQAALVVTGKAAFPADLNRPAATELASESEWYRWVNPNPDHVPTNPMFNVFGDIRTYIKTCAPFLECRRFELVQLGDLALMPGSDKPTAVPFEGGARFLPGGRGPESWQWGLQSWVELRPWALGTIPGQIADAAELPQYHGNLGARMDEITVEDCQTKDQNGLDDVLVNMISKRMLEEPYPCQP